MCDKFCVETKMAMTSNPNSKKRYAHLTKPEEQKLFVTIKSETAPEAQKQAAREVIILKCQGYVIKLSKRYSQRGVEMEDLIQEGNIGLMQAIERFDPERGFRFLTYAYDWIRRALGRATEEKGSINIYQVRTPCYIYLVIGRINKHFNEMKMKLGREPTNKELAKVCDVSENTIAQALTIMRRKVESLDRSVDTGESRASVSETIAADEEQETENVVADQESTRLLDKALARLTPLERKVIELRFGMHGTRKHTQDEVWKTLNINRAKVATIQQRALNKLRGMPEMSDLTDVLG